MSNMTIETEQQKSNITDALETMIDAHGLQHVLIGLELVCEEKADHIRCNWQDNLTARRWDAASKVCGKAARNVAV